MKHIMLNDLPCPYLLGIGVGREAQLVVQMMREEVLVGAYL